MHSANYITDRKYAKSFTQSKKHDLGYLTFLAQFKFLWLKTIITSVIVMTETQFVF